MTTAPTAVDITADPRWQALCRRDNTVDPFIYAVITTGIYCRPGCPSRRPKPDNIRFFATPADAEQLGFRACKRCQPQHPNTRGQANRQAQLVAAACRQIETAASLPSLDTLAAAAGLSPFYFHRTFKKITGVTPKAYAVACRRRRLRQGLSENTDASVTDTLYDAGFNTSSRFYEAAPDTLGMTPGEFKNGAAGITIRYATAPCALGQVLVAVTDRGVCAIELGDSAAQLAERLRGQFAAARPADDPQLDAWLRQIVAYIDTPAGALDLPLDIQGTAFQQQVWQALRGIPAGATVSYAELAAQLGRPQAARAVARACAGNRLALAIPCHRVVRSDGSPSGYRWGCERKQRLLEREAALAVNDEHP